MSKNRSIKYVVKNDYAEIEITNNNKTYKTQVDLEDIELCKTWLPETDRRD